MHLSHFGMRLKNYITVKKKKGPFFSTHTETTISISSLLWNWWPPRFCFSNPNKSVARRDSSAWWCNHTQCTLDTRVEAVIFWGACRLSTLFNKIMSGGCKGVSPLTRREMVFETSIYLPFDHLTWLVAQEYFNLVTMKAFLNYISTLLLWPLKRHVGGGHWFRNNEKVCLGIMLKINDT